jgi:hypothetical protein
LDLVRLRGRVWFGGRLVIVRESLDSAVFGFIYNAAAHGSCGPRGLNRRLAVEIGFGPVSEPLPVWRLAGHGLGTAGFRHSWMSADCDCCRTVCFRGLIRKSDTDIVFRSGRTLESMCVRLCGWAAIIEEPWYSAVLGWVRAVAIRSSDDYLWADSGIGMRDWIWFGFGVVVGLAAGCSWSENRRIPTF